MEINMEIEILEDIHKIRFCFDDKEEQALADFITFFPSGNICELVEATKKIKSKKLDKYAVDYNYSGIEITPDKTIIKDQVPGEAKIFKHSYDTNHFERMINTYCALFKEAYSVDLSVSDDYYEPLVEGIITNYKISEKNFKAKK